MTNGMLARLSTVAERAFRLMSNITLEELQDMGVRCSTMRSYLWFKHFVEVGPLDVAAYFLGRIYKRSRDLPEPWSELQKQLEDAEARQ